MKILGEPRAPALIWLSCSQHESSLALWKGADYGTPLEKDLASKGKARQAHSLGAA